MLSIAHARLASALVALLFLLAACGGTATPTAAPKAAEPTKPAAATAAPTTAPAATKPAEPTKPAAAATTAPATGATAAPAAGKEIVVGLFGPMSGPQSQYGKNFSQAIALATDDLNKAGGINGRPVKIVEADDRNDNKEAANIAERFAADPNIVAVIGGFSSAASLSAAPIYQKAGITQLCPTCSHPTFTKEGDKQLEYIFSLSNPQALEGPFNAKFTATTLGKKKVAVLWRKDDWGLAAKDQYEKAFKDLGGEVVLSEGLADSTPDFKPVLTKIRDLKPDVVYLALFYNDAAVLAQQAKQIGFDIPFVASGALYNIQFLNLAKGAADGMYLPTTFFPSESNPKALEFAKRYKERYNVEADNFAAHAYDSAQVLFDAMKRSDLTRKGIRDALAQTKDWQGTTGVITFDADRRVAKEFTWLRIQNNEFVYYKPQ
jgi:branched-chain amino acid transport system substrate-binding protein